MKKYLDFLNANFTLITLVFYVFGYTYLSIFYYQFEISISQYVNLTDILFTTINTLVLLFLIYLIVELVLYIMGIYTLKVAFILFEKPKIKKIIPHRSWNDKFFEDEEDRYHSENIKGITLFLFFIGCILLFFFTDGIGLLSFIVPMFIIKIYQIIPKDGGIELRLKQFFFALFVVLFLLFFAFWGYMDGTTIKKSNSIKTVELKESGFLYTTNSDSLNFVGETNEYIFLYNKKGRETLIFNKSTITNLKIKDLSQTDQEKETKYNELQKTLNTYFDKLKGKK